MCHVHRASVSSMLAPPALMQPEPKLRLVGSQGMPAKAMASVALLLLLCADPASAPPPKKGLIKWPDDAGPRPDWADRPGRNPRYEGRGFPSEKARKLKRKEERAALEAEALALLDEALQAADMFSRMAANAEAGGWGPVFQAVMDAFQAQEDDPWHLLHNRILRQFIAAGEAARGACEGGACEGEPASASAGAASSSDAAATPAAAAPQEDLVTEVIEGLNDWERGRRLAENFAKARADFEAGLRVPDGHAEMRRLWEDSSPASLSPAVPSQAAMADLLELQQHTQPTPPASSGAQPSQPAEAPPSSGPKKRKEVKTLAKREPSESEAAAPYDRQSSNASARPSEVSKRSKAWRSRSAPN